MKIRNEKILFVLLAIHAYFKAFVHIHETILLLLIILKGFNIINISWTLALLPFTIPLAFGLFFIIVVPTEILKELNK